MRCGIRFSSNGLRCIDDRNIRCFKMNTKDASTGLDQIILNQKNRFLRLNGLIIQIRSIFAGKVEQDTPGIHRCQF